MHQPSFIQVISDEVKGPEKCGYCKKENTHFLEGGIWTFNISPHYEQILIEHSWRRCGKFIYLLDKTKNCCPLYMIRCDAEKFVLSHSQRKVMRRMTRYLKDDIKSEKATIEPTLAIEDKAPAPPTTGACKIVTEKENLDEQPKSQQAEGASPSKKPPKKGVGADPKKAPCKKKQKIVKKDGVPQMVKKGDKPKEEKPKEQEPKTVEEHINNHQYRDGYAHKLETKLVLVNPESAEYKATEADSHRIYERYQQAIHGDKPGDNTLDQFKRFLVTSAVKPYFEDNDLRYGCYHLQYFIDGKLFMVGVLDILPRYISSVYTYYDPDFMFLSPGVYSALAEIELTQRLQKQSQIKKWYCLGYFIYSIPKMRYKGDYFPSYLNCPYTHKWLQYDKDVKDVKEVKDGKEVKDHNKEEKLRLLKLIQTGVYQKLDDPEKLPIPVNVNECKVLSGGKETDFETVMGKNKNAKNNREKVQKYCEQVGPIFSKKVVAIFDFI